MVIQAVGTVIAMSNIFDFIVKDHGVMGAMQHLSQPQWGGLLDLIGTKVVNLTQERIDTRTIVTSGPMSKGVTMHRSGVLRGSFTHNLTGSHSVEVGSNVVYAAIQHYGGETREHDIYPRFKQALFFGGKFYKKVHHPGSKIHGNPVLGVAPTDEAMLGRSIISYINKLAN